MKSIIDSFAKEEQAILIVALFLLIYVGTMINVMVREYRTYLDDYPMYHFSLGDFIRRGRFYICLILGVVYNVRGSGSQSDGNQYSLIS